MDLHTMTDDEFIKHIEDAMAKAIQIAVQKESDKFIEEAIYGNSDTHESR